MDKTVLVGAHREFFIKGEDDANRTPALGALEVERPLPIAEWPDCFTGGVPLRPKWRSIELLGLPQRARIELGFSPAMRASISGDVYDVLIVFVTPTEEHTIEPLFCWRYLELSSGHGRV